MPIKTHSFQLSTQGDTDIKDITGEVAKAVKKSGYEDGMVTVFVPGSTAGITTIEFEPGLLQDLPAAFEKIAPVSSRYAHNETWHDGNGHAHVRAALVGASFSAPFSRGKLLLGTWQQIVLIDFDNRPRQRDIIIQIMGENHAG